MSNWIRRYLIISSLMVSTFIYSQTQPYVINNFDTIELSSDQGEGAFWSEYDETEEVMNFSTLSQIETSQVPDGDSPVMDYSYGVVGTFNWGGYTGELNFFDQAVDLSAYNYLSFKIYNIAQPQISGVTVRVCLFDASDASSWSSRDDLEVWYSFFENDESFLYNTSEEGWVEYRIPLQESGTSNGGTSYTLGFTRTGWVGISGNNAFDINSIGGIAIEVVSTVSGETVSGEFLIEDIQAIAATDIYGCTDVNACNYDPEATVDDGSCYECSDITFRVDMSLENEVHPDGVYLAGGNFGQDGYLMNDSDEDGIWEYTLELEIGETFLYKFRNQPSFGTWDGFEPAGGLASGGCASGAYDDRFIIVPETDTVLDAVCYGSCVSCDDASFVDVTFSVNMQDEEEVDPQGAYLSGEAFPAPGLAMSDINNDGIYEITVTVSPGSLLRYKFANGPVPNWNGQWEEVPEECQHEGNTDRWVQVGQENLTVPTVCFGGCLDCLGDYTVDITFNVDMNDVAGFDGSEEPYIFGSYNNWDNFATQTTLSDDDGDNIYTGTILDFLSTDSVTVLFGFGQTIESVPAECGVLDNELGLNVRELPIMDSEGDSVLVLDPIAFGNCPLDNSPRVFFQVDVSSIIDQWPADFSLCAVGSFASWNGCGLQLTDDDGDNIYTGLLTDLEDGVAYEYKFLVNEGWNNPNTESGAPIGSDCDYDPSDEFNNYGFLASEGVTPLDLGVHPWNECPQLLSNDDSGYLIPDNFTYTAYPNPFNPTINIDYALPNQEFVNLSIINLLGQKVKTLVNNTQESGNYSFKWDGKDLNGVNLQSGIYFAVINRNSGQNIIKITYLK